MKSLDILQRRNEIVEIIKEYNEVSVVELSKHFSVSDETIRNDLKYLEEKGIVKRKYGGAELINFSKSLLPVFERNPINSEKKEKIAKKALTIIEDKNPIAIGLDQGNTVGVFAKQLTNVDNKQIFTSSLAAIINCFNSNNELYCFGGKFSQQDMVFRTPLVENAYENLKLDICFMGSSGVKNHNGICTTSIEDVKQKRLLLESSNYRVVLLDSSKFQTNSVFKVSNWSEIDLVITDDEIKDFDYNKISQYAKIIVA